VAFVCPWKGWLGQEFSCMFSIQYGPTQHGADVLQSRMGPVVERVGEDERNHTKKLNDTQTRKWKTEITEMQLQLTCQTGSRRWSCVWINSFLRQWMARKPAALYDFRVYREQKSPDVPTAQSTGAEFLDR
jgi:hypothetical protein